MNEKEVRVQLERWKGYSAYEVAVRNGFNGTEKEWLEHLGGNINVTVNGRVVDDTGNITVTAEHMTVLDEGQITVAEKLNELTNEKFDAEDLVQDVSTAETDKPMSAAAGKAVDKKAERKTETYAQKVALPVAKWEKDGEIYGQSVAVEHITIDQNKTSAIVSPPTDRTMEEVYLDVQVRAAAQGDGVLVFTCIEKPEIALEANVMVIVQGVMA